MTTTTKRFLCLLIMTLVAVAMARKPQPTKGFNKKLSTITGRLHKQAVAATDDGSNIVLSPFSISVALGMTLLGARGNTEAEIKNFTNWKWEHQGNGEANVHNSMRRKIRQTTENGPQMTLNNAVFVDQEYPISTDFTDALEQNYLATQKSMDFRNHPSKAVTEMNDWIEQKTGGLLKDMIPQDAISSDTKAVLVNAINFNGLWENAFKEKEIIADFYPDFKNGDKDTATVIPVSYLQNTKVPMLIKLDDLLMEHGVFFALPYKSAPPPASPSSEQQHMERDFSTYFIVGKPNSRESLDWINNNLDQILGRVKPVSRIGGWSNMEADLKLPKFDVTMDLNAKAALQNEGLSDLFDQSSCDLSGMSESGSKDLFISDFLHKARVQIDSKGTKAAAASGAVASFRSYHVVDNSVTVDVPFFFGIYYVRTNSFLFTGVINNPGEAVQ